MEHTIVALAAGRLAAFLVAVGDHVTEGAELAQFDIAVRAVTPS